MSDRQERKRNAQQRSRIAAMAGRLIAEEGINDVMVAKKKAARLLGLPNRVALPDGLEVEAELRTYQRLFQGHEQQDRNTVLLRVAARLMSRLLRFNPYLTGAVLDGSAGRYAEIDIQLFPDSAKDVEIFLLNESMDFRHSIPRTDRAEAVLTLVGQGAVANLIIYPRDEERVTQRTRDGRVRERARLEAVNRMLAGGLDTVG